MSQDYHSASLDHPPWVIRIFQSVSSLANSIYPPRARRAWEWCDFESTPAIIRRTCQDVLSKQWTRCLFPLQSASPAVIACKALADVIDEVHALDPRPLEVFEFAAGSGGPTPVFEQQINRRRRKDDMSPIEFRISDLLPNSTAWQKHIAQSGHLTVIEESVDATDPPPLARR
jgi:hypothetical protein